MKSAPKDYIFLARRIKHSPDLRDAFDRLLLEDLLLAAAWDDRERTVGGAKVLEPVGSVFVSRRTVLDHLGRWCRLSAKTVFRRLGYLEERGVVKLTPSGAAGTLVEFVQWKKYQVAPESVSRPQPRQGQHKPDEKHPDVSRPGRVPEGVPPPEQGGVGLDGGFSGRRVQAGTTPESVPPPEQGGAGLDGGFSPGHVPPPTGKGRKSVPPPEQGGAGGNGDFSAPAVQAGTLLEVVPPTIKDYERPNTTSLKQNLGPGPVRSGVQTTSPTGEVGKEDRTGPGEGQGEEGEGTGEEPVRTVCKEVERIAHEWGATGVNLRKEKAREMVRAALAGEYPCERQPDWKPRRAYTPAEIVEAARWFYQNRQNRTYTSEAERKRFLQLNWLLGVNNCTGEDALAEACRKAKKAKGSVSTATPAELERGEALEKAEYERKLRRLKLLHGTALPAEYGAQQEALRAILEADERWSLWDFKVKELLVYEGSFEPEDLEFFAAAFAERFGHDPREGVGAGLSPRPRAAAEGRPYEGAEEPVDRV